MLLLGDLFRITARRYPDNTSTVYEDRRFSFRETDERISRLANALLDLGVRRGDRVAIMQTDCHQYVETDFAAARIGAVYVPLNYRLREAELEYLINDSGSTVIFSGDRYAPLIDSMRDRIPGVRHCICYERPAPSWLGYEDLLSDGDPKDPKIAGVTDNDVCSIQYSSGTTGLPKGAMLTHRAMVSRMMIGAVEYDLRPGDRVYVAAPMFHVAGFGLHVPTLLAGGTAYMITQFDPRLVAETIQNEKLTGMFLVPSMINFLLRLPDVDRYDFRSLRFVWYGAAPMPVELLKRAVEKFGCEFYNLFGAGTEAGLQSYLGPEDHRLGGTEAELRRLGSIGKPPRFVDVRVVNEEGEDVRPGEVGEIISKSSQNMAGYWNKPEATAQALADGWFRAGDMATVDEDGYLYLVDRKMDMINRAGENIYPVEIENVIYQNPKVLEAAVIGVPDQDWGEAVKAVIAVNPGQELTAQELLEFCKRNLASYKCPTSVDFIGALPRNPSGKVLKRVLREPYWKGTGRKI